MIGLFAGNVFLVRKSASCYQTLHYKIVDRFYCNETNDSRIRLKFSSIATNIAMAVWQVHQYY